MCRVRPAEPEPGPPNHTILIFLALCLLRLLSLLGPLGMLGLLDYHTLLDLAGLAWLVRPAGFVLLPPLVL